jgi:phenylalanyl-tRNA synthetase beta chain
MDFDVASKVQHGYLERLGCEVREVSEDHWEVNPPSWRYDLGIEEDLIEEIARLHGYEHIGQAEPRMHFVPQASDPTHRKLKERLAALGLQEVMTYVFTGAGELERAGAPTACVQLSSPQGIEKGVLRTALFPGLLAAAALNRHAESLAFFEVGHVFGKVEEERVAIVLIGDRILGHWRPGMATDFFALKGILENLAGWEGASLETLPEPQPSLHPGVSAKVLWNGRHVGFAGQVHPEVASAYDLKNVYIAELKLPLEGKRIAFSDIVRQPFAERDLAIVVPLDMTYARLSKLLRDAAGEKLLSIAPFDDYRGPRLPPATRSLAIRFRFQDAKRALTDEQVDKLMDNIIQALKNEGYELRT